MSRERVQSIHAWLFTAIVLVIALAALMRARTFQPPPVKEELIDGRMAHAFESHYDDAFPVRTFGISLWAAIDYALFHEARSGVVIGRDGWLYTDEEFVVPNDAERELEKNLSLIASVRDQLAQRDIRLVMAIVPAKARVYPEHLDRRAPPPLHRELYPRVQEALDENHIASAQLLAPMLDAKQREPMFLRTDTHWTPQGARMTAQAIARVAQPLLPEGIEKAEYRTTPQASAEHRGDLFNFLPLEPYFGWLLPSGEVLQTFATSKVSAGNDLLGDAQAPQVALVGTSYSAQPKWNFQGALEDALQADVGNYAKEGAGPFAPMLDYLRSGDFAAAPPRLVIWEIPERYLVIHQPEAVPTRRSTS